MLDEKYYKYTASLLLCEGKLGERKLMRLASDKSNPSEEEVKEMEEDLDYLASQGYIQIKDKIGPVEKQITLEERGRFETQSIATTMGYQIMDDMREKIKRDNDEIKPPFIK